MPEFNIQDIGWILLCTALVLFMQAGFCCLESGLVRSKNSINVSIKNFADFSISAAIFWIFGFGIMFGGTYDGWFGTTNFLFNRIDNSWLVSFFIFQMVFCGTATTIVAGAVAERTRFLGYIFVSIVVSGIIYPFLGHWLWGGSASGENTGWLSSQGFIDFAGSTVVHSTGGWVALAAVIVIGPRIGRFNSKDPIQGQDLPMATLGVFILWFGWLGFNGGSTLSLTGRVPVILANTILSGAFGSMTALILSWQHFGLPKAEYTINGALAGLVSITASANIMTPLDAVFIGMIGGSVCFGASLLLEKLRIDDVVGAFPVHAGAGIWGTFAVAIFGNPELWGTGLSRWEQFVVQAKGVGICFAWAFGMGIFIIWLLNRWFPLRVSYKNEIKGLNVTEHGSSTAILELIEGMNLQEKTGDFSMPLHEEPNTEVGQFANKYNEIIDKVLIKEIEVLRLTKLKNLILDSAGEGIYGLDLKGNTTFCNPAAAKMIGYEIEELLGKPQHKILHHSKPDGSHYPREECLIYAAFKDGKVHHVSDEVFWKKDGSSFPVEYVSTPIRESGKLIGAVVVFKDITLRKKTEDELEKHRNNLEGLIDDRTMELKSSQKQLIHSEKLASLGKLTGSIAHEFNNPLQGIRNAIKILGNSATSEIDLKLAELSRKECDRMANMIKGLGDFYKPTSGNISFIDINQCIEEVLFLQKESLLERGVQINQQFTENLPKVEVVEDQIKQVILNLIQNSADSITGEGQITLTTEKQDSYVKIKIQDTGHGISEEDQKNLFEPFFSTKGKGKGTGLGLSISYGIIHDHGGDIEVESELDKGTTITVSLPIKD